jgi:hypothetical protein
MELFGSDLRGDQEKSLFAKLRRSTRSVQDLASAWRSRKRVWPDTNGKKQIGFAPRQRANAKEPRRVRAIDFAIAYPRSIEASTNCLAFAAAVPGSLNLPLPIGHAMLKNQKQGSGLASARPRASRLQSLAKKARRGGVFRRTI